MSRASGGHAQRVYQILELALLGGVEERQVDPVLIPRVQPEQSRRVGRRAAPGHEATPPPDLDAGDGCEGAGA